MKKFQVFGRTNKYKTFHNNNRLLTNLILVSNKSQLNKKEKRMNGALTSSMKMILISFMLKWLTIGRVTRHITDLMSGPLFI